MIWHFCVFPVNWAESFAPVVYLKSPYTASDYINYWSYQEDKTVAKPDIKWEYFFAAILLHQRDRGNHDGAVFISLFFFMH